MSWQIVDPTKWQETNPSRALPEPFTRAWVKTRTGQIVVATRTYRGEWQDSGRRQYYDVTHWQALKEKT